MNNEQLEYINKFKKDRIIINDKLDKYTLMDIFNNMEENNKLQCIILYKDESYIKIYEEIVDIIYNNNYNINIDDNIIISTIDNILLNDKIILDDLKYIVINYCEHNIFEFINKVSQNNQIKFILIKDININNNLTYDIFIMNPILYNNYIKSINNNLSNKQLEYIHKILKNENQCFIKFYEYIILAILNKKNTNIIVSDDCNKYYDISKKIISNNVKIKINLCYNYNDFNINDNLTIMNFNIFYDLINDNKLNNIESITIDNINSLKINDKIDNLFNNTQLIFISNCLVNDIYKKYFKNIINKYIYVGKCFLNNNEDKLIKIFNLLSEFKNYMPLNNFLCISSLDNIDNIQKYLQSNNLDCKIINSNMNQKELNIILNNNNFLLTSDYDYTDKYLHKFYCIFNYDIDVDTDFNTYHHYFSSYLGNECNIIHLIEKK
jgi:hypothetical protein